MRRHACNICVVIAAKPERWQKLNYAFPPHLGVGLPAAAALKVLLAATQFQKIRRCYIAYSVQFACYQLPCRQLQCAFVTKVSLNGILNLAN